MSAEFLGTPVQIVDHAGQKWLTAEEAGRCLGYDHSNARKGVLKIYERHGDEFLSADTFVVKMTANPQGGNPTARIFSATGCIKLGFFASTPRAKEFRAWASQVLSGQPAPAAPAPLTLGSDRDLFVGMMADLQRRLRQQEAQIAGLTRQVMTGKDREIRYLRQRSVEDTQRRIDRVIQMEASGYGREEIVDQTGLSFNYVRQIVFRARRDGHLPPLAVAQASLDLAGAAR
jgi:hypothetical protein